MGWLIVLVIILLVLAYPLRIRIEASCHTMINASIYWQPLPFFKKKPKIKLYKFEIKNPLAFTDNKETTVSEQATAKDEETLEKNITKESKKTIDKKARKTKKPKKKLKNKPKKEFDWKAFAKAFPWKSVMDKSLAKGNLEELKLHLILVGNPAYACLGGGLIWMNLGWLLGVLSTKLHHFPKKPDISILWREKSFDGEVAVLFMVRLGSGISLGIYLAYILLRERKRCKDERRQSDRRFAEYGNGEPA